MMMMMMPPHSGSWSNPVFFHSHAHVHSVFTLHTHIGARGVDKQAARPAGVAASPLASF